MSRDSADPPATTPDGRPWLGVSEALARRAPPGVLDGSRTPRPSGHLRYGFRAAGVGVLIEVDKTGEVLEDVAVYPVPNTAPWLLGLINLRGDLVPVLDLDCRLDGHAAPREPRRLLVIDRGEAAAAFVVDDLPVTVALDSPTEETPPLPAPLGEHVRAAYLRDREVWLDIDFEGLLFALGEAAAA